MVPTAEIRTQADGGRGSQWHPNGRTDLALCVSLLCFVCLEFYVLVFHFGLIFAACKQDFNTVIKSTPGVFGLMVKKFGIESAIRMLFKKVCHLQAECSKAMGGSFVDEGCA